MSTMAMSKIDPEIVAAAFAGVLRGWLSASEWTAMRRANGTAIFRNSHHCASHDFCDANGAMELALKMVASEWYKNTRSADEISPIWTQAWDIAKARYLTAGKR